MTLNEKIKQLLSDRNLSPSHFADQIGVQRSSISHILAGRNRPSLDIIQKIVRRFPDLGLNWILDDQFPADKSPDITDAESMEKTPLQATSLSYQTALEWNERNTQGNDPVQPNVNALAGSQKSIERIVVFYSDGTFSEYTSAR
jgi:transcriptional regulator with XRE-family HTH domain